MREAAPGQVLDQLPGERVATDLFWIDEVAEPRRRSQALDELLQPAARRDDRRGLERVMDEQPAAADRRSVRPRAGWPYSELFDPHRRIEHDDIVEDVRCRRGDHASRLYERSRRIAVGCVYT